MSFEAGQTLWVLLANKLGVNTASEVVAALEEDLGDSGFLLIKGEIHEIVEVLDTDSFETGRLWTLTTEKAQSNERYEPGKTMCQLCFGAFTRAELAPVEGKPGMVWDVCIPCDVQDKEAVAKRQAAEGVDS